MAPLLSLAASLLALAAQSSAHFNLKYPTSAGFSDENESTGPCGSFDITDKTNSTDFHVGGDVISLKSGHPTTTYLFRVTPDMKVAGNFTNLLPSVMQDGLGDFCEPSVMVPESFAGSKGVLQVVAHSPDGILYQCALVNFVSGNGAGATTANADCKNASTVTGASFVADTTLSAAATGAPTGSASASSSGASSTASHSAAAGAMRSYVDEAASVVVFAGIASVAMLATLL